LGEFIELVLALELGVQQVGGLWSWMWGKSNTLDILFVMSMLLLGLLFVTKESKNGLEWLQVLVLQCGVVDSNGVRFTKEAHSGQAHNLELHF